jgi:hypothetical protein
MCVGVVDRLRPMCRLFWWMVVRYYVCVLWGSCGGVYGSIPHCCRLVVVPFGQRTAVGVVE